MSRFNSKRLQASALPLDWEGLRRGDYSDRYFWNGTQILQTLAQEGYRFAGGDLSIVDVCVSIAVGTVNIADWEQVNPPSPPCEGGEGLGEGD